MLRLLENKEFLEYIDENILQEINKDDLKKTIIFNLEDKDNFEKNIEKNYYYLKFYFHFFNFENLINLKNLFLFKKFEIKNILDNKNKKKKNFYFFFEKIIYKLIEKEKINKKAVKEIFNIIKTMCQLFYIKKNKKRLRIKNENKIKKEKISETKTISLKNFLILFFFEKKNFSKEIIQIEKNEIEIEKEYHFKIIEFFFYLIFDFDIYIRNHLYQKNIENIYMSDQKFFLEEILHRKLLGKKNFFNFLQKIFFSLFFAFLPIPLFIRNSINQEIYLSHFLLSFKKILDYLKKYFSEFLNFYLVKKNFLFYFYHFSLLEKEFFSLKMLILEISILCFLNFLTNIPFKGEKVNLKINNVFDLIENILFYEKDKKKFYQIFEKLENFDLPKNLKNFTIYFRYYLLLKKNNLKINLLGIKNFQFLDNIQRSNFLNKSKEKKINLFFFTKIDLNYIINNYKKISNLIEKMIFEDFKFFGKFIYHFKEKDSFKNFNFEKIKLIKNEKSIKNIVFLIILSMNSNQFFFEKINFCFLKNKFLEILKKKKSISIFNNFFRFLDFLI